MVAAILAIIGAALQIWEYKEKRKYIDEFNDLKNQWYVEINKPEAERDQAVLDNLKFKIKNLAFSITVDMQLPQSPT